MDTTRLRLSAMTAIAAIIAALSLCAFAGDAADTPEDAARRYVRAEASFDQPALRTLLAADFVEISPRGEVDERDRVLGFYAPENRTDGAPALAIDQVKVREAGDHAVVTARVAFVLPAGKRELTLGIAAVRTAQGWQLASAQYTPVAAPPPTPPKPPIPPQPPVPPVPPSPAS